MTYQQINFRQRYKIEYHLKKGTPKKEIAKELNICYTTVYREIKRNTDHTGVYNSSKAQYLADSRLYSSHLKTHLTWEMKAIIHDKISEDLSPEQVKGWCDLNNIKMLSIQSIYGYIWVDQERGGKLHKHLRTGGKTYRKKYGKPETKGQFKNRKSIDERPEIVDEKSRIGDWEIDLIVGKNGKGGILTMVERATSFLVMANTYGKTAEAIKKQVINGLAPYKEKVFTITNDNGKEFMQHEKYGEKLDADVFFCHPYASHERGLNEYTNKLIRQYIPKKTSFKNISALEIMEIQRKLNSRPRKKYGFLTPNQLFLNNLTNNLH